MHNNILLRYYFAFWSNHQSKDRMWWKAYIWYQGGNKKITRISSWKVSLYPSQLNLEDYYTKLLHCNVMIKELADHGLHLTYQLYLFVLKSYMPQSYLLCHCYELFFVPPYRRYNLIFLVPTRPLVSTSSFWSKSPTGRMWATNQARLLDCQLMKSIYRSRLPSQW